MPVATGGADCRVHCHYLHCPGDASGGTGTPFQTLDKNPYARAEMDASAYGKGDRSGFGHVA